MLFSILAFFMNYDYPIQPDPTGHARWCNDTFPKQSLSHLIKHFSKIFFNKYN